MRVCMGMTMVMIMTMVVVMVLIVTMPMIGVMVMSMSRDVRRDLDRVRGSFGIRRLCGLIYIAQRDVLLGSDASTVVILRAKLWRPAIEPTELALDRPER